MAIKRKTVKKITKKSCKRTKKGTWADRWGKRTRKLDSIRRGVGRKDVENCAYCGGILTRSGFCNKCGRSEISDLRAFERRK